MSAFINKHGSAFVSRMPGRENGWRWTAWSPHQAEDGKLLHAVVYDQGTSATRSDAILHAGICIGLNHAKFKALASLAGSSAEITTS